MNSKFTNSLFNYNINLDPHPHPHSQNFGAQSPIFGGATAKGNKKQDEPTNQILINNNFINIQQTIGDPNVLIHQPTNQPEAQDQTARRKFYFRKNYQIHGSQKKRVSPSPSPEDLTRFKINLAKPHAASVERVPNDRAYIPLKKGSLAEASLSLTNRSRLTDHEAATVDRIRTERDLSYGAREEIKEENSPFKNRVRQNIIVRKDKTKVKSKSQKPLSQKMKDREKIYNDGFSPVGQLDLSVKARGSYQDTSRGRESDNSFARSHNVSLLVEKGKKDYVKTGQPVNTSQTYEKPPLNKRASIEPIGQYSIQVKPKEPVAPKTQSKSPRRVARNITTVRRQLNTRSSKVHSNDGRTDKSARYHTPTISTPIVNAYKKLDRSLPRKDDNSATIHDTSPDEDNTDINEDLEKVLHLSMNRFNDSMRRSQDNSLIAKNKQKILSTMQETQQRSITKDMSKFEDSATIDKDSSTKLSSSPYGTGVEVTKAQKQAPAYQKLARIKSEEVGKAKPVNYGELFMQARRNKQEIEDYKPFVELNKSASKSEYEYIPKEEKLHEPNVIFTKAGFIEFNKPKEGKAESSNKPREVETNLVMHDDYLQEKAAFKVFASHPFFKYFKVHKLLILWKVYTRRKNFEKKREMLRNNYVFGTKVFSDRITSMNNIKRKLESFTYLVNTPKTLFTFYEEPTFKKTHEKTIADTIKDIKKVSEELNEFIRKLKEEHSQALEKLQREIDGNINESMLYKLSHGKEHVSKANMNAKYREYKQMEQKYLTANLQKFFRIMQLAFITSVSNLVTNNEQKFSNAALTIKDGVLFEADIKIHNSVITTAPEKSEITSIIQGVTQDGQTQIVNSVPISRIFEAIIKNLDSSTGRKLTSIPSVLTYIDKCIVNGRKDRGQPIESMTKQIESDYSKFAEFLESYKEYEKVSEDLDKVAMDLENFSVSVTGSVEKNVNIFKSIKWIHQKVRNLSVGRTQVGSTLILNFFKLENPLQEKLNEVLGRVKGKYIKDIEQDLADLKLEIMQNMQKIQVEPQTIDEFVTSVQEIETFVEKMESNKMKIKLFEEVGKYLQEILKTEPSTLYQLIGEARESLKRNPEVLRIVLAKFQRNKKKMSQVAQKSFKDFSEKMTDFKRRYVNSYFKDKEKIAAPELTFKELEQRDENIEDIKKRLDSYLAFDIETYFDKLKEKGIIDGSNDDSSKEKNKGWEAGVGDTDRATPATLTKMMESIEVLHKETKRLWKSLAYWSQRKKKILTTVFSELNLKQAHHTIAKVKKYLNEDMFDPDNEDFGRYARGIHAGLLEKLDEMERNLNKVALLKKDDIPETQWRDILRLLGFDKADFTFETLLNNPKFDKNLGQIRDILKEIKNDTKFEEIVNQTYSHWQKEEVAFKLYKDVFILNKEQAMEIVNNKIQEYKAVAQQLLQKSDSFSSFMKKRVDKLVESLEVGEEVVRKLVECDEEYVKAEILEEELVRKKNADMEAFLGEFKDSVVSKIKQAFSNRKTIIEKVKASQMFLSQLTVESAQEILTGLDNVIASLRDGWQDVSRLLNKKRQAFPRLYFLDDMGIVSLYKSLYDNIERPGILKVIFPGIWKLDMREELRTEKGKQLVDVESSYPGGQVQGMGMKHGNAEERRKQISYDQSKEDLTKMTGASNIGELRLMATKEGVNVKKALIDGLVDGNYELFRLKKPIYIKNKPLEVLLKDIEIEMQDAVFEDLNKAIGSFPNHSLDEWILDFPTQVVVSSLHLIVTHEVYEMIKLLTLYNKSQKKPKKSNNLSASVSGTIYSGSHYPSQYSSNASGHGRRKRSDHKLDEEQLKQLKEEAELILHKPTRAKNEKKIPMSDPQEKIDLFGQNFDSKYLGANRTEMHTLLQQRSFRGLYTRLQFWVHLIIKHLYDTKEENLRKDLVVAKNIVNKYCNVLSFILFLRDTVLDVYENSTDNVPEFEWNKHVRMILEGDNKACIIECGGWAGYQGNEFIGGASRLMITPVTERYFIFISSALREKSAVSFQTVAVQDSCSAVVEEFANLCTIPLQKFKLSPTIAFNLLINYVNAAAHANTWVALEHIEMLNTSQLSVFCKEVQLVQQKVIIADLKKSNQVPEKVVLAANQPNTHNPHEEDAVVRRVAYGLFCSILPQTHEPKKDKILLSSFRSTSLVLPDFEIHVKNTLYIYGFASFIYLAKKVMLFKDSMQEKMNKSGAKPQSGHEKPFLFKLHEILNLLEKFKEAKENMKGEYFIMQAGQNQRQKTIAKPGISETVKNSSVLKEARAMKEDVANPMKYNTEEDVNAFEKAIVACVLAQYTIEKIKEYLKFSPNKDKTYTPQEYKNMVLEPLTQIFRADKLLQDFVNYKLATLDMRKVYEATPYSYFPYQGEQVHNLYHALGSFGCSLVQGEAYTGKSSVLTLLQKYLENIHSIPADNFNVIRLDPSLLSNHYKNYNDALHYLLSSLTEINQPDNINFVVLDGEPSSALWDLLMSFVYVNRGPASQNSSNTQLFLENWPQAKDFHRANLKKMYSLDGKVYQLEANTYLIVEVTSLANCPPNILGSVGLVSTGESLGIEHILEIFDKKLRAVLQETGVINQKQLFNLFVDDFWSLLGTYEKEFLHKAGSFSLRGVVLSWLKLLEVLMKESSHLQKLSHANNEDNMSQKSEHESVSEGDPGTIGDVGEDKPTRKQSGAKKSDAGNMPRKLEKDKLRLAGSIEEINSSDEDDLSLEYSNRTPELPSIELGKDDISPMVLRNSDTVVFIEYLSTVSLLWTLNGVLPQGLAKRFQKEFVPKVLEKMKSNEIVQSSLSVLAGSSVFEYFFDSEQYDIVKMTQAPLYKQLWQEPIMIEPNTFFIPNLRAMQALWMMKKMAAHEESLALITPRGTGRSAMAKFLRAQLSTNNDDLQFIEVYPLNTRQLKSFYDAVFSKYEHNTQTINKPPLVFIEDVSLNPSPSEIDVLDFLRFWKLGNGLIDLQGRKFKNFGKPRCMLMMKEDPSEGKALHERRFYFESLKLQYFCLDSEETFKAIYTSILSYNKNPPLFKELQGEILGLLPKITQVMGDLFKHKRLLHGKVIDFLKSLAIQWQDTDSITGREFKRKDYALLLASSCKATLFNNLSIEPREQTKIYGNLLDEISSAFKCEKLTVQAAESSEVVYPSLRVPQRSNPLQVLSKKELFSSLRPHIKSASMQPVSYISSDSTKEDNYDLFIESIWNLYKSTRYSDSHFCLLSNYGDFISEYLNAFSQLTHTVIKKETFSTNQDSLDVMKKILTELFALRKTQTHILVVITGQEIFKESLMQDLYQWIHRGIYPLHTDIDFETAVVADFKEKLKPPKLYDYLKNGDPNLIDDNLIIADFKRDIKQRLHFCFHIETPEALKEVEKVFPAFKEKFIPVYPFYSKLAYQERICKNVAIKQQDVALRAFGVLRSELMGKVLFQNYVDLVTNSENLAISYEESGIFDKYDYFELMKIKTLQPTTTVNKYVIKKDSVCHIDEDYFSLKKFVTFTLLYKSLFKYFSTAVQSRVDKVKSDLKGMQDLWSNLDRMKINKSTITSKALSMNVRMREIEKQIEAYELEMQNRKTIFVERQEDVAAIKLQKRIIINSFTNFVDTQYSTATDIAFRLKQITESEFHNVELKTIKSPRRVFSIAILVYTSLFDHEKILSDNANDSKILVEMLQDKRKLIEKLEEAGQQDEKTFKAPNLKVMGRLKEVVSSFVSIDETKLPPILLALYKWCEFWNAQVIHYYEFQAKLQRLRDIDKKLTYSEEYLSSFEKNSRNLEKEVTKLQAEKQKLTAEDAELNLSLAVMEVENNHFEIIDKVVLTLEKKFKRKITKLEKVLKSLEGDMLVLSLSLAYLGIVNRKEKIQILENFVSQNQWRRSTGSEGKDEIRVSDKWTFDDGYLEKYLRLLLKIAGKEAVCKKLQFKDDVEKLGFYEVVMLSVAEKESSELKEFMKGNTVILCNSGVTGQDLQEFVEKTMVSLEEIQKSGKSIEERKDTAVRHYTASIKAQEGDVEDKGDLYNKPPKKLCGEKAKEALASQLVIGFNEINMSDAWIEMKKVFWKSFIPEDYDKYREIIQWCLDIDQKQRGCLNDFTTMISKEPKGAKQGKLDKKYQDALEGYDLAKDNTKEVANDYETLVNSRPLLSSYSNILIIVYQSYSQFANLVGRTVYTWKAYLSIIRMIIKKLLRDVTSSHKRRSPKKDTQSPEKKDEGEPEQEPDDISSDEDRDEDKQKGSPEKGGKSPSPKKKGKKQKEKEADSAEIIIDEEFFADLLLPSVIHVLAASLPIKQIPLFNLLLAINVGAKRDTILPEEAELIVEMLTIAGQPEKWKQEDIMKGKYDTLTKEDVDDMVHTIRKYKKEGFETIFEKLYSLVPASKIKEMSLRKIIHEFLKKKEGKEMPLSQKMILSLFSVHADMKSIFSQFIYEEFISIFDYQQEDLLKIHSFIKVASWHIPVAIFTDKNVNIVNTVCSIASFYGVDISVVEVPKAGRSEKQVANYKKDVMTNIQEAALKGSWILVTDLQVLEHWKDIDIMLKELDAEQKIVNSFRLLFDFQDVEYEELPVEFITENAVIYHLGEENMEDMEGFNDIWANLLENVVNADDIINMTMSEREDSKAPGTLQNLRLGNEFTGGGIGNLHLLDIDEDKLKGKLNFSIDHNVKEDVLSICNLSVIKKLNESKVNDNDSILEANRRILDSIPNEESYLEGTRVRRKK